MIIAGNIEEIVLVKRSNNYQRTLYVVPPRTRIPHHKHNNVRVNITFLDGQMIFMRGDRQLELFSPADSGRSFIIEPEEEHGAFTVGASGIFIVEQYWLNDEVVRPLHLNWQGEPINEQHARELSSCS